MNRLRSVAPLVALVLLAVFLMPPTLSVLSPVDGSSTLPEDMDSTPDIVLVSIPVVLLGWQALLRLDLQGAPSAAPRPHPAKVDPFELACILIC